MIRHHTVTLLLAAAALAQKDDQRPVFKTQARELMEPAAAMVPAVHPQIQVAALRDLGELFAQFDRPRAITLLEQGFQAALAVSDEAARATLQGGVLRQLGLLDAAKALELAALLSPDAGDGKVKPRAFEDALRPLIGQGQVDRAFAAMNAYGAGEYPFQAATALMEKLEAEDGRRLTLFGSATAAFQANPRGDFGTLIRRTHASLPRATVQAALAVVVNALLGAKPESITYTSISTAKGSAAFASQQELELFKIFRVLEEVDPKRAAEVLQKHPGLKDALAKMPGGLEDSQGSVSTTRASSSAGDAKGAAVAARMAAEMEFVREASAVASKDPRKGIDLAEKIEKVDVRGRVLSSIASAAAEKDPAAAEAAITKAIPLLEKMEDPLASAMAALELVMAAHEAKRPALVRQLLDHGFTLTERLTSSDRGAKSPNTAPRDVWPSTQLARLMMNAAAETDGPEAIAMLERWKDPELRLVAQIAMARRLLGLELKSLEISVLRSTP